MDKFIHYLKIFGVLIFIIIEEITWKRLGYPIYKKVKSLKIMNRFKSWVSDINNRYILLAIFVIPFVLMEISSIFAVKALIMGFLVYGIGLYVIKALLTIPVVIIFNTGKKILVSFSIIKYGYGMILRFKRSNIFKQVKIGIKKIKEQIQFFKIDYLDNEQGDFMNISLINCLLPSFCIASLRDLLVP